MADYRSADEQTRYVYRTMQSALGKLGLAYQSQNGVYPVQFSRIGPTADKRYILLVVDMQRLPRGVTADALTADRTLRHLSRVLGYPVVLVNTRGVVYAVNLDAPKRIKLPDRVTLPEAEANARAPYSVAFGVSASGVVEYTLGALGHMLVAGSSGYGKSVFLRSVVYQLARGDSALELYLADMEGLTFNAFTGLPMLARPIARTEAEAEALTVRLMAIMDERAALYDGAAGYPETIDEYNARASSPLARIVAIYDEFSAMAEAAGKTSALMEYIAALAMRARKYGITLVLAGQDFKADLLNTRITNQLKTRVQFKAETADQSRVVLGDSGAEGIRQPGRALVRHGGQLITVQTYYVSKETIAAYTARYAGAGAGAGVSGARAASRLPEDARRLAEYARDELGGRFLIARLAEAFSGSISQRRIQTVSQEWERRGWLQPGRTRADSKILTSALLDLLTPLTLAAPEAETTDGAETARAGTEDAARAPLFYRVK